MKWELHAHTSEGSTCGHVPAWEVVFRHMQAGFSGIVITDHYNRYNLENHPGGLLERTKSWLSGYEEARKAGERLGVAVLFGAEIRLSGSDNDYLIYGAEPEMLLENPALIDLDLPAFSALAKRYNAVVIQAHPNRLQLCYPVNPVYIDGYEVFNGNRRQENQNERSEAMVKNMPPVIQISGSDYHQIEDLDAGSMEFTGEIHTSAQLVESLHGNAFQRTRGPEEIQS